MAEPVHAARIARPLLGRLRCLWSGHVPSDDRDWIGRPLACERCGASESEIPRRAWERLCGRAAIRWWSVMAEAEMARRSD